jgi:signal transduction histidine kinase/DNA-binding response OmpR family regulator
MVLSIIIITSGSVLYWGYNNYDNLTKSLNQFNAPDYKISMINELFQEIVEADNFFNGFILTNNNESEKLYYKKIAAVNIKIAELESLLSEDSMQRERLDSLQNTLAEKNRFLKSFSNIKKKKLNALFTNEALNRITKQINDSAYIEKKVEKNEQIVENLEPYEKEEVVIKPDDYEGVNGFFRKLFGKENLQYDTIKTIDHRIDYSIDFSIDTSIIKDYFKDTTLFTVKSILIDVMAEEIDMQDRLNSVELELIKQDQQFIAIIKNLISKLKEEEQVKNYQKRNLARIEAKELTRELYYIGGIGIALSSIFIFLIVRDVTRATHYRQQLEEEKKKAEEFAKVKEEFLSKMSHEIRTPLHSIIGFSDLMLASSLDGNQKKYMNAIAQSNLYLQELIDNILDQAKIDAGKLTINKGPIFVPQLVEELELVFQQSITLADLKLQFSVSEFLQSSIFISDLFKIKQVLMNLISNAIKFTEEGHILVKFTETELVDNKCDIRIEVSDTGKGIESEEFDQIFQQFQQGSSGKYNGTAGTGLGLSITKSIVEAIDGEIAVESEIDKGSTFIVKFQALWQPYSNGILNEFISGKSVLTNDNIFYPIHILVVEDDIMNAQLLIESLKYCTDKISQFFNAEEGMAFLETNRDVDIIVTDINLPGVSGEKFMKHCKSKGYKMPIIALTAHIQESKKEIYLQSGFDNIYTKPFSKSDIMEMLSFHFKKLAIEKPNMELLGKQNRESLVSKEMIDTSYLMQFANEDNEVYQELVKVFIQNYTVKIKDLSVAYQQKDLIEISGICHQLKSSLEQIQYTKLSEDLLSIELYAGRSNEKRVLEELEIIMPLLKKIEDNLKKIKHQFYTL